MSNDKDFKDFLLHIANEKNGGLIKELFERWEQFKQEQLSKRDWEIVSCGFSKETEHEYISSEKAKVDGGMSCEETECQIYSVRRLSDGEILVLDEITNQGRITGFHIEANIMVAEFEGNTRHCDINLLQKAKKQVLFLSDDDKQIFKGDSYWVVNLNWEVVEPVEIKDAREQDKSCSAALRRFSTKEKAEEYILMNKPILSLEEILGNFYSYNEFKRQCLAHTEVFAKEDVKGSPLFKRLKQLAKSKMDKK